jgi:hypothetical protein
MSKRSKALGIHEPLRLNEHSRPRTRREFLAQGFLTGAASVVAPTLAGMLAYPRAAAASGSLLAGDIATAVTDCNITTGAGKIPFICFDLAGGGNIAGSNVLVGGPKGQLDFLSVAGYSKLGLPGSMVPNPSASGNFIDPSFGLRFHADSAHLRGMKLRASAKAMAGTNGTVIPALSQNDTNTNPHNPMYGIYQYGARGGLLNLIGSVSSQSGGNSMSPPTMVISAAMPTKISSSQDSKGLVSTGQLTTLLPPLPDGTNPDVVNVMESMKRISDAKYNVVQAYADSTLNSTAIGPTTSRGIQACSFTKAAYVVDKYGSPSAVNPDLDPNIVGTSGIFQTAEYHANSDYQKTAAVMKLVIDGNAAAGTIQMGGFDYHSGNRMDGEARDLNLGNCIGACLEYAARVNKPVMIYVFTDGSLASSGMIDNSVGGRGKGVWTGDNQNVAATYFLVFNPNGRPVPAQPNPEMSLQIGNFNPDGSLNVNGSPAGNNVPNLVQMVVLNYMALHGDAINGFTAGDGSIAQSFPTLFPAPNLNNNLGSGSALEPLIAFQPLIGLQGGRVPG